MQWLLKRHRIWPYLHWNNPLLRDEWKAHHLWRNLRQRKSFDLFRKGIRGRPRTDDQASWVLLFQVQLIRPCHTQELRLFSKFSWRKLCQYPSSWQGTPFQSYLDQLQIWFRNHPMILSLHLSWRKPESCYCRCLWAPSDTFRRANRCRMFPH